MLFDTRPKTKLEDLFDRIDERKALEDALYNYPLVIVTGLRRVGKSSLIKAVLNELQEIPLFLDGRGLYSSSGGNITRFHLIGHIESELARVSLKYKIVKSLKELRGVSIKGNSITLARKELSLSSLIERLDKFAAKNEKNIILYIDEAQYLKYYGSRGGKDLLTLLAFIYDNLRNTKMVITGSEIGLLHDFLKLSDYESPLYGRAYSEICIEPFKRETSIEFLKKGFAQINLPVSFDIEEVVDFLDGIPGYLVLFGVKYREFLNVEEAIERVFNYLSRMISSELKELEKRSPRYLKILEHIAMGVDSWTGLKRLLIAAGDIVSDSRLYEALNILQQTSWIKKTDGKYDIVDPVLKRVISEISE
jgi:hypothetical protein